MIPPPQLIDERIARLRSIDYETFRFVQGNGSPPIVCGSAAWIAADGRSYGELLPNREIATQRAREYLDGGYTIVGAHIAYDFGCLVAADSSFLTPIFKAYQEGRVHDILIAQALHAIGTGHLGIDPRTGGELRKPSNGKVTKRYSLDICADLVLGRVDAKKNDTWRSSYALLEGISPERWPEEARQYPVDDAINALDVAVAQLGTLDEHLFNADDECIYCGWHQHGVVLDPLNPPRCLRRPRRGVHENLENLAAQCEAAFALHLGALWGLRTDRTRVEKLSKEVDKKHEDAVTRYQTEGWIRENGKENQIAVRTAVALAYGVDDHSKCERCGGVGTVPVTKLIKCRGLKLKGRYKEGCLGAACTLCFGRGERDIPNGDATCKAQEGGCDGTTFDLRTAPLMPRSDKGGIKADRDTLTESGNESLTDYGEDEFEKCRTTFIPWLRSGFDHSLPIQSNVLVASGRCSYEGGPLHQIPRDGGVRECIRARDGYLLTSTDYEAGELVTLSTYTNWVLGYSRMRDAINASGKPGILHSELAAEVLGISLDEFLVRLKAKDKQAVYTRQAAKPTSFGSPALMGSPKIVLTNRKKNAGFTVSEYGPARNDKGEPGYNGSRFCILIGEEQQCGTKKLIEWKGRSIAPVCKRCVEIVEHILKVAYFRRFPEIKEYFKWVFKCLEQNGGRMPCLTHDPETGGYKIVRWRGGLADLKSAACNNGFQAMLADVIKLAYVRMTREGYLGVKPDGSPSPLRGGRFPAVMHDEPISELPIPIYVSGPRVAEIMVEAGLEIAPGVAWRAETAGSRILSKAMEPVYNEQNQLVEWVPIQ